MQGQHTRYSPRDRRQPPGPPSTEPHNVLAEQAVLAACLQNNTLFLEISGTLAPPDFLAPGHAEIYGAIGALTAEGQRADVVTLLPKMREAKIGDADLYDYIVALPAYEVESHEQFRDYVGSVQYFAAQRALLAAARDLMATASQRDVVIHDIVDATIGALEQARTRIRGREVTRRDLASYADMALSEYSNPDRPKGLRTKFDKFDEMTGGLFRGELSIVGGRPGSGKTMLASQIALNVASLGHGVLYLSLEMDGPSVAERLLSSETWGSTGGVPYSLFRSRGLDERDMDRLKRAKDRIQRHPLHIETQTALSLAQATATCRRVKAELEESGRTLDLLIVDYLTLMKFSDRWKGQRVYEVAELSTGLKALARSMNIHVMAVHQLSRGVESREDKRPTMSDLRESGQLEQDADVIGLCYRESYYLERSIKKNASSDDLDRLQAVKNDIDLILAKQRQGAVGTIQLYTDVPCNVIRNKGAR